jgi:phosphate transport system permease protein
MNLLPADQAAESRLKIRRRLERVWSVIFRTATIVSVLFLGLLLYNILNQSFGLAAIETKIDPATLTADGKPLEELDSSELIVILQDKLSKGKLRQLEREQPLSALSRDALHDLVWNNVVQPNVATTWSLVDSIFRREQVMAQAAAEYPDALLKFTSWINPDFIGQSQSSNPLAAGIRTAILGSLWTIAITILFAFPIGVGSAIFLEEYADDNRLNQLIQTNINNLAGVPSIIYGMLGLAIFVRILQPLTSGAALGLTDPAEATGRTILSAGLTLGLLVLPLIIINAQEAIRAVPGTLRQASYGLGATKWQTIWHHVLPSAVPGILTGTILAISRAIGETAPLVVVGAATYITFDPSSPFSKFTTLPIQIYQWTARPQVEFRNLAAAAILALLALLLSLNAVAVVLRNRYKR